MKKKTNNKKDHKVEALVQENDLRISAKGKKVEIEEYDKNGKNIGSFVFIVFGV